MMNFIKDAGNESKLLEKEAESFLNQLKSFFIKEGNEDNLLKIVLAICWLGYTVKDISPQVKKLTEMEKFKMLRDWAVNSNLAMACKDLQTLTQ